MIQFYKSTSAWPFIVSLNILIYTKEKGKRPKIFGGIELSP